MEGFEMTAGRSVTAEMVTSRQTQEVQGQIIMAKKFPRDENESYSRIMRACQRRTLAEKASYEYRRGDTKINAPSIRLAEVAAQNWGNISFGIVELEQKSGESTVMSFAWDLETNVRQEKIFTVPHIRHTKKGDYPLTDPRDVYEMVANQGARRLRACILGIIPGDIIESAMEQCNKTLIEGEKKPLADVVKEVCLYFQRDHNVPIDALEKFIGCKADAFSMNDCIRLRKVYNAIKDGISKREDYFDLGLPKEEAQDAFAGKEEKDKKEENTDEGQQQLDLGGGENESK